MIYLTPNPTSPGKGRKGEQREGGREEGREKGPFSFISSNIALYFQKPSKYSTLFMVSNFQSMEILLFIYLLMKETFPLKNAKPEKLLGQHIKHFKEKRKL